MNNYSAYSAAAGMSTGTVVVDIIFLVYAIVCLWVIFEKAGEPGWKAIIPIYNAYIEFKIAWGKGWMFLLCLVPVVNIVIGIMFYHKLSKSFGHGVGFTLGLIFLAPIFLGIMAFGSNEYIGPQ